MNAASPARTLSPEERDHMDRRRAAWADAGKPMPAMDLTEFRRAAHGIAKDRREAVEDYENQIDIAAAAEAEYQKRKATKIVRFKSEGLSATEAVERSKGDDWVCEAQIKRDTADALKKAKLERINGIDAERASLHRIAEWSMQMEKFA